MKLGSQKKRKGKREIRKEEKGKRENRKRKIRGTKIRK
jgi:hypothetical protein